MKAYLLLTGLIGLVELGGAGKEPPKLMVLLLKTDFRGSVPHEVALDSHDIAIHSPRVEFWPAEVKLPTESKPTKFLQDRASEVTSKYSWQIEGEDIEIKAPGKALKFSDAEREKFVNVSRVVMDGRVVKEEIRHGCVEFPIAEECRAGIVGRVIIGGGVVSAVELGKEPESLDMSPFDQSLWQFRSTKIPTSVSSNYFTFASAVLVDLGEAKDVEMTIAKWPSKAGVSATRKEEDGVKFRVGASSPKSGECKRLLGDEVGQEACAIVHILNVNDTADPDEDPGGPDKHFALFSSIVETDDLLIPFRKMFFVSTEGGSGSKPSGRCVPKIMYIKH